MVLFADISHISFTVISKCYLNLNLRHASKCYHFVVCLVCDLYHCIMHSENIEVFFDRVAKCLVWLYNIFILWILLRFFFCILWLVVLLHLQLSKVSNFPHIITGAFVSADDFLFMPMLDWGIWLKTMPEIVISLWCLYILSRRFLRHTVSMADIYCIDIVLLEMVQKQSQSSTFRTHWLRLI